MTARAFYHEGMRELQDRHDGRRLSDALERHRKHDGFWAEERELIQAAPCFFIATSWGEYVDCSIKSGDPGFVKIVGPGTLEYPEYDGNSMFRTLGNISRNPNVGLLFVAFDGRSRRIRVNGHATILEGADDLERHFGARLVVRIECEIYPNCPRYVPDLVQGLPSPHTPRRGEGPPPAPDWKAWKPLRDHLPKHDPHRASLADREPMDRRLDGDAP